jgi:hypothetical protein
MAEGGFYWCLVHERVEPARSGCPNDHRMGPYASEEEALHWKDKVQERNQDWEEEDRRWDEGG